MTQHLRIKALNFSWVSAEQGVRLAIGFFVMTLVARALGPEEFAAYSYVFALFGLAMPLARFGLNTMIVREASLRPDAMGALVGSGVAISLALSVIGAAIIIAIAQGLELPGGVDLSLLLIASFFVLAVPGEAYLCYLRAREKLAWYALPRILVALLAGLATLIFVLRSEGLASYVAIRSAEAVLLSLAALGSFLIIRETKLRLRFSFAEASLLLKSGLPLMIAGFGMIVLMRVDQVLLGQLSTEVELGNYAVAVRVAEVANFIPVALHFAIYPAVVRSFGRDPARFNEYAQRVFDSYALASWPAMLGLMFVTWFLLVPVFGSAYTSAIPMTLALCAAIPFFFLQAALSVVLTVEGRLWTGAGLNAFAAIMNFVLNLAFIPHWGGLGAAVASALSLAAAVFVLPLALKQIRWVFWQSLKAFNPIVALKRLQISSIS